jgi:2-polyprenyl-6-methoxyphenol hydroxylase-like FAD-dependent oxidoreductase
LLAAHALAGGFERVTVLECYSYPSESTSPAPSARRGAPQSRCIHLLMAAGAVAFDQLMPSWREEIVARGAGPFDACADAVWCLSAGRLPRTPSGITAYACSRALLEGVLRRGLAGKPTVQVREGQKVIGLLSRRQGERVTGVLTVDKHGAGETALLADLVVDASGAASKLTRWVARLPNGARLQAKKTVTGSCMQYVSRWFQIQSVDAPDWRCLSVAPAVGTARRSAMMLRAEENRWAVVLLAPAGETLPCDDTSFAEFIADLGDRELQQAFGRARPVSPILRYGPTSNRMKHFDSLTEWPQGLVAIGDSVCTLDPYFGLGMTLAARGAALLRKCLDQQGTSLSALDFQKKLAELNVEPWRLATGRELDGRPLAGRARLCRLYDSAPSSPEIAHALLAVQHLLRPAETLREVAV